MQISFTQGPAALPPAPAYRILVLAPLVPTRRGPAGLDPVDGDPADGRDAALPLPVERGSFKALLERLAPQVSLEVENLLTSGDEPWWVPVRVRALSDFTAAGLIRQVPELAWIEALRQAIAAVAAGVEAPGPLRARLDDYAGVSALGAVLGRCRQALAEPPPAPRAAPAPPAPRPRREAGTGDDLDRIFDLVDAPGPAPQTQARSAVAGVIAAVSAGARERRPSPALAGAAAAVADLLARQVRPLLAHPRLRTLEAAWRGLHLLLQGLAPDAGVQVLVMATDPGHALADLEDALAGADAAGPDGALDLVLMDLAFTAGPADTQRLAALARAAQGASVPLLVALDAGFFEAAAAAPLARVRDPARLLEGPAYTKWNAARDTDAWRWVCGCFNDFVLRTSQDLGRDPSGPAPETTLWGQAPWLVARRILEQVQHSGWPAPIAGGEDGRLRDLTLCVAEDGGGAAVQRPLRHPLAIEQCRDLADAGVLALGCRDNQDSAWIVAAPSLRLSPALASREETAERRRDASLSAQLVRARLIRLVLAALGSAPPSARQAQAQWLARYLNEVLSGTGAAARAQVHWDPGASDAFTISVVCGERVLPGLQVELQLGGLGAM